MADSIKSILTTAPVRQIEDWLKEHNVKYCGSSSVTFSRWVIEDERDRILFILRWGKN